MKKKLLIALLILSAVFGFSATTFAATVTNSGLVTLDTTDVEAIGGGLANMGTSVLSGFFQILPYIFIMMAVGIIIGLVYRMIGKR